MLDERSIFSTTFNSRLIVTFGKSGRGEFVSTNAYFILIEDGLEDAVIVVGSLESVEKIAMLTNQKRIYNFYVKPLRVLLSNELRRRSPTTLSILML